ncbi:hypothetical protein [Streptomyces sp. NPDC048669]|uniref:hypothetical protein n=1 Tax=Streptomyces sp. NPDC048669 TaxID=3155267 RepID=UPI003423CAB4
MTVTGFSSLLTTKVRTSAHATGSTGGSSVFLLLPNATAVLPGHSPVAQHLT